MFRSLRFGVVLLIIGYANILCVQSATSDLIISEFLASNSAGLRDEDGDSSDWIEIQNTGLQVVDLAGLSLTDDASAPTKWIFPAGISPMNPGSFLIVFASDKNRMNSDEPLHTNFKLTSDGEYLGLYAIDGTSVISEFRPSFPSQTTDRSYGINNSGSPAFFDAPSPGFANGLSGNEGDGQEVVASVDRGFYVDPFVVTFTSSVESIDIRYTRDGSTPKAQSELFDDAQPLAVSTTTVLRAAAFSGSVRISGTSSYSYVFLNDVIRQPSEIDGFPNKDVYHYASINKDLVPQDTEMDPEVVNAYAGEIINSLVDIPTISISSSSQDIFGEEGFYFTSDIEKSCSMEILSARDPSQNEQIDVGIEGHSRNIQKRAFRLNFRSKYGSRQWVTPFLQKNDPLGRTSATNTFRTLILRSGSNRSWARTLGAHKTAYSLDEFYRSMSIAMTGSGSHGTFVHLYLNGVYWGMYNIVERPDENFQAAYFGGNADDWFFTNHGYAGTADSTRFDYLIGTLSKKDMDDHANFAELQEYLNLERFADYMLLAFYIGLSDWPFNNWYAGNRNDSSELGTTPLEFFAWDGEISFDARYTKRLGKYDEYPKLYGATIRFEFRNDISRGYVIEDILTIWYSIFRTNAFRTIFDDRVKLHTAPGGVLTDDATIQRWDTINAYIESAVVAESARWGDSLETLGNFYSTRTRDVDWYDQVNKIRTMLDGNTQQFLDQYSDWVSPNIFTKLFRFSWQLIPTKILERFFSIAADP